MSILYSSGLPAATPINREELVTRHNITFDKVNPKEIPQVGNGEIAFGVDVTGLQTFYGNSMAQWGWHSSPLPKGKTIKDFKMHEVEVHDRVVTYPVSSKGQKDLYGWLRKNPHRLNLGKFSLLLDGKPITAEQLSAIKQKQDLWRGVINSTYKLDGVPVQLVSVCHPRLDIFAVQLRSPLIRSGRLAVGLAFPYGNPTAHSGADWKQPDRHQTRLLQKEQGATFQRQLDDDRYQLVMQWQGKATVQETAKHVYALKPQASESFSFVAHFAAKPSSESLPDFAETLSAVSRHWQSFWMSGGAIDLSESKNPHWRELERRVVLSQYLLAVNEAGSLPPQESGLLNNSGWYGKFHLEMHWWHGAHYQLWKRWELFDRSLGWYREALPVARQIAKRQNYRGGRWPKMVGPDGRFGPSGIGPWLIWQQPHPIFFAEQNHRIKPGNATLEKWKDVVFASAEFMASYAYLNKKTGKYDLGPWVINAAENNDKVKHKTINPVFELSYWRYGLDIACQWRKRMGLPEKTEWLKVLNNLAPLPQQEGVYVMWQGIPDMWKRYNRSHIDIIGPGAFLPNKGVDRTTLGRTVDTAFKKWKMESTWGWDFPWLAMAAARVGKPGKAIEALMMKASYKNDYSLCGINKGGPAAVYFPGNGGLLYAVAMMAAGWDGCPDRHAPGFPDDGSWVVKHEGLMKAQ